MTALLIVIGWFALGAAVVGVVACASLVSERHAGE